MSILLMLLALFSVLASAGAQGVAAGLAADLLMECNAFSADHLNAVCRIPIRWLRIRDALLVSTAFLGAGALACFAASRRFPRPIARSPRRPNSAED